MQQRRVEVEKLAKELLVKEVLFKSDVEALIGKRPFEEKKLVDMEQSAENQDSMNATNDTASSGEAPAENNVA